MSCRRCQGLLLIETRTWRGAWWWRCVNCGEVVDRVILRHRAEQAADLAAIQIHHQKDLKEWADWFARVPV